MRLRLQLVDHKEAYILLDHKEVYVAATPMGEDEQIMKDRCVIILNDESKKFVVRLTLDEIEALLNEADRREKQEGK